MFARLVHDVNEEARAAHRAACEALYRAYRELHDSFGRGGTDALRRLSALRRTVRGKDGVID